MHVLFTVALLSTIAGSSDQAQPVSCSSPAECRQMALEAADRQDYEDFHTLAWRAVQTGRPNDPDLLYLLARSQSLSGRPHDALIMLRRLADRGFRAVEAETSDAFRRVRSLPGWADVLERIHAAAGPATPPARVNEPVPSPPPKSPTPPPADPTPVKEPPADDGLAIPAVVGAIAIDYDAVSRRFVLADESSSTLKILDELSGNAMDLVSRGWAAPYRTSAIVIDRRRGDLWVTGSHVADGMSRSAMHRLQLVSGRLLYAVALPAAEGPARFADVALAGDTVLALDAEGRRLFELIAGAKSMRVRAKLVNLVEPTSLAVAGDSMAYIAHASGLARLNLTTGRMDQVRAARKVRLEGLQWIREHNGSLVGIQEREDRGLVAVRVRLDPRGRSATSLDVVGSASSRAGAVSGDVFYYLAPTTGGGHAVRRVGLR